MRGIIKSRRRQAKQRSGEAFLAEAPGGGYFVEMLDRPAAILFDFDGVIVDSEPVHFQAFVQALGAEGIGLSEHEYYRELIGFDDRGAFGYLLGKHGRKTDTALFDRLMEAKRRAVVQLLQSGQCSALAGVERFVRGCQGRMATAICSGALREEIEMMLEGVGLRDCFEVIVSAEDVAVGKPDPSGYLLAAGLVGRQIGRPLAPEDCLVIEDAPSVIHSVRRAGFWVLAVTTSYPPEKLADAHWIVPALEPATVMQKIPQLRME